jgi:hypothetical protein
VAAQVVEGRDLRESISEMFGRENVSYLHVHNARPSCYNCSVLRVPAHAGTADAP